MATTNLPELTGTVKQISYATSERADQLARYDRQTAAYEAALSYEPTDDEPLGRISPKLVATAERYWLPVRQAWLAAITTETNSATLLNELRQIDGVWDENNRLADPTARLTALARLINEAETVAIVAAKRTR